MSTNRALAREVQPVAATMLALMMAAAALFHHGPALGDDLIVRYDQSQLLRLPRPVADIIIGNPSIADVSIQGGNMLVVTGKTFGITNIIALDSERNIIQDQRIIVERDELKVVNLTKAGKRQSYSCTPNCSPTLTIGDDTNYFELVSKHNATKTGFSASGGEQAGNQQGGQ